MTSQNALLGSLYLNLRGDKKKKEDWISIAKKCAEFASNKSHKEVAEKLGVSTEIIRAVLSLLELPIEVQQLIKEGKILFDAAQRINTIDRKVRDVNRRKKRQIEVAKTIAGLPSHEQREIIQYAKKYPNVSLSNFKKRVTTSLITKKLHVAVIPLDDELFGILKRKSMQQKISLEKMILSIIDEWKKKKVKTK
ncbi:MAG: hypothetical protein ACREA3_08225 [Nitrosotalea sp.]